MVVVLVYGCVSKACLDLRLPGAREHTLSPTRPEVVMSLVCYRTLHFTCLTSPPEDFFLCKVWK